MIDKKEAERMLRNIIKGCPRVREPETLIAHCKFIAEIVVDTIRKIKEKIPEFDVDENEMEVAALLHDIGYCFAEDALYHPIVGGEFLEEKRLHRIALIIRGHTYAEDTIRLTGYKNLDAGEYEAKTWNEVLINYASLHCGKPGELIDVDEKFRRFYNRKKGKFREVIKMGEARVRQQCIDVDELVKGNKEVLKKYSFL